MGSSNSTPRQQEQQRPIARPVSASAVLAKTTTSYPAPFQDTVAGRSKRALGNHFGLTHFGVNHTTLEPGASSALQHHHSAQDELVYILQGTAVCRLGNQEIEMKAGDCMGFPAGQGVGHCIVNRSDSAVVYLEIGDRMAGDIVDYPEVDLKCIADNETGDLKFVHKDGRPYGEDET